mgnify:CR=1 FL=1|tara:strand:- start:1739 stop:2995 length:1257 start_codon:yes stop_codon:yes gene_type:complete
MPDAVVAISAEFWGALTDMAPYLLLGFLVAGILSVVISERAVEAHLGGRGFRQVVKACLIGVPLPLCSCSVIPVSASLYRHGAGRGPTTAFLLSTPQTGVDSIMVTYGLLGPVLTVLRPIIALITGLLGGSLVNAMVLDENARAPGQTSGAEAQTIRESDGPARRALHYGFLQLPAELAGPMLVGLLLAGLIGALVPADFFPAIIGTGFVALLAMMFVSVPLYVCATASVPIAAALLMKGVSPGAVLVFLIAGPATNAASLAIIWRVLGRRTTCIYLATVVVMALASGLLVDQFLGGAGLAHVHAHGEHAPGWLKNLSAVLLLGLLVRPILWRSSPGQASAAERPGTESVRLRVDGMTCDYCAVRITKGLLAEESVQEAIVDRGASEARIVSKNIDTNRLIDVIESLGYEANPIDKET